MNRIKAPAWLVGELMSRDPVILLEDATLDEALAMLERYPFRHFPVARGNRVVGIVSDRDLRLATAMWTADRRGKGGPSRIEEIMRRPVHCLPPNETPAQAAQDMVRLGIGAIPVVEDETLVGIVTESDCLEAYVELCRTRGGSCDDYVRHHMQQPLPVVDPEARLTEALDALDGRIGHLVAVEDGRLAGIVSERDLRMGLARERLRDAHAEARGRNVDVGLRVRDVMAEDVTTVGPSTMLSACVGLMLAHKISALPVLDADRRPLGILTQRDVLQYYASLLTEMVR